MSCGQAGDDALLFQKASPDCGSKMKFLMPSSLQSACWVNHCFGIDLARVSEHPLQLFLGKTSLLQLKKQPKTLSPELSSKEGSKRDRDAEAGV